jgi:UDP-N-acetyl-D-mannosaminuronic acid transferase (WecB/TagA/CpsF family)/anti-anti-sigma regulatory factor
MNFPKIHKNIKNLPLAILGIPINNLKLPDLIQDCIETIQKNKSSKDVSYFSTLDKSFVTECYGWRPTIIDNPEMLFILRHADIPFVSGMLLRGLTKLLGSPAIPSYNSNEFLTSLCHALNENEMGVFILGGIDKEIKNTAVNLHDHFKKLRLVGIASPPIFLEGEDLVYAVERDLLLVEQINSSNADLLLVNLENVKQGIWIERVRHLLSVPLVISINYSLSEISEEKHPPEKTPPPFSFTNFLKFIWMSLPLIIFHTTSRILSKWFNTKKTKSSFNSRLFLSSQRAIAFISLPECLDRSNVALLEKSYEDASSHDVIVFDFKEVRHIQPEGFYLLIRAWLQRNRQNKEIYAFSPSADIQTLMKLHRTWDIFKDTLCDSAEILMARLIRQESITFYDTFNQDDHLVTLSLLGSLDNRIDYQKYIKKITPIIGQKNCNIDFSYCTYIDNTGFSFLLNLRKQLKSQGLILSSVHKNLRKQFRKASVEKYFTFAN